MRRRRRRQRSQNREPSFWIRRRRPCVYIRMEDTVNESREYDTANGYPPRRCADPVCVVGSFVFYRECRRRDMFMSVYEHPSAISTPIPRQSFRGEFFKKQTIFTSYFVCPPNSTSMPNIIVYARV